MADPTGWMPGVNHIPGNEWGYSDLPEDGMYPQAVIHHVMQGYKRTMDDWAASPQPEGKSVHFAVARNGSISQYVSIWNPAYHAGIVADPDGWGQVMLGRYGNNPNRWTVGIEQEGFSQPLIINGQAVHDYIYDAQHPWPQAMIDSVIAINRFIFAAGQWLIDAQDKKDRILTHNQFDTRTRPNDPGQLWIDTVKPLVISAITGVAMPIPPTPVPTPPVPPAPIDGATIIADADAIINLANRIKQTVGG